MLKNAVHWGPRCFLGLILVYLVQTATGSLITVRMWNRLTKKVNMLKLSAKELAGYMASIGEPAYRAKQVLEWIYQKGATSFAEMTNLPQALRDKFEETAKIGFLDEISQQVSADGTEKYLFGLSDGQTVETVILPYEIGYSACISTQVGCKIDRKSVV